MHALKTRYVFIHCMNWSGLSHCDHHQRQVVQRFLLIHTRLGCAKFPLKKIPNHHFSAADLELVYGCDMNLDFGFGRLWLLFAIYNDSWK